MDGLAAEREQNITIDVAYRFFATARRKFIVIDAPGHEEYTANMATGASVADLALVLVAVEEGLTRQTKRHLVILSMLGIRHVVLAVNKMDRVGWSRDAFGAIEADFRELAADLGFVDIVVHSGRGKERRQRHAAVPHTCRGIAGRRCSTISKPWSRRGPRISIRFACRSNGSTGPIRISAAIAA